MKKIFAIAEKEVKIAFQDRIFLIVTGLFIGLSIISVYIGSTTKNAELQAYQNIVSTLRLNGAETIPPAPIIYPLSILKNIITYVSMIGSVVAIFLGFEAFSGERNNGTLKIIAVRPLYRDQIITGKLLGGAFVIGLLLTIILIFNLSLFIMISGVVPSLAEVLRFFIFFGVAFTYLMVFYIATLYVSIKINDSTFGFMLMMIIWIAISFVIPQLADSQRNFAYALNATTQTITQVPSETVISKLIEILSPAAQFQNIGGDLLQAVPGTALVAISSLILKHLGSFLDIVLPGIALLLLSYKAVQREEVI